MNRPARWVALMETKRQEARKLGASWSSVTATRAEHCTCCGLPVSNNAQPAGAALVAGFLVCCGWCAGQVLDAVQGNEPFEPVEPVRACEVCGAPQEFRECHACVRGFEADARREAERAEDDERDPSWDGEDDAHDGRGERGEIERCSSCGELGCLGDCEQGEDDGVPCAGCSGGCLECRELEMRDEPTTAPGAAGELGALVVGARCEVLRGARWVVARVTHEDEYREGAGTLFESEPRRRVYVETVTEDGGRGLTFEVREGDAVRMVEVGLFG